jgi:RNA polymerase sigma-70 factor (ECF subfamily)
VEDREIMAAVPSDASPDTGPTVAAAATADLATPVRSQTPSKSESDRRAALTEMMEAHGEAVFGFCARVLRDRALAEDMTQQVFLEAYRDLDRFQRRSSLRTWLFGIAYHRCLDLLKSQRRRSKRIESNDQLVIDFEDPGDGPIEYVGRAQLLAALEQCLKALSPEVRATVLLRFRTGFTYEELAAQLAATADALQIRVARALPALRRCLVSKGWTGE